MDKVIIAQESVAKFVNDICPGAYTSVTKATNNSPNWQLDLLTYPQVDFNALDSRDMKPIGVYGSISAIVDFLRRAECIDEET